jgi:hypothetical protein
MINITNSDINYNYHESSIPWFFILNTCFWVAFVMKYYSCTQTLITFETGGEHIPEECTQILTLSKEVFEVPSGLVLRVLENGRAWWPKYLQQENNTPSLTWHCQNKHVFARQLTCWRTVPGKSHWNNTERYRTQERHTQQNVPITV